MIKVPTRLIVEKDHARAHIVPCVSHLETYAAEWSMCRATAGLQQVLRTGGHGLRHSRNGEPSRE
jgi:hypothetical protein